MASATATRSSALSVCLLILAACPVCTGRSLKAAVPGANLTTWYASVTPEPATVELPMAPALEGLTAVSAGERENLMAEELAAKAQEENASSATTVFYNLRNSADELKKQIEDAWQAHRRKVTDHEEYLKGVLKDSQASNRRQEDLNANLRAEIAALRQNTQRLFERAKQLKMEGKVWMDNWQEIGENFTLVLKVAQASLQRHYDVMTSPSVDVVDEEQAKVVKEQAEEYRNELMEKVVGGPLSLLMIKDPVVVSAEEKTPMIARVLNDQLSEMAEATDVELRNLDEKYKKFFQLEADREVLIRKDTVHLLNTKAPLLELQAKLQAAVSKLEALKKANEKRGLLVRVFSSSLGANDVPTHGPNSSESWRDLLRATELQRARLQKDLDYLNHPEWQEEFAMHEASANATLEAAAAAEAAAEDAPRATLQDSALESIAKREEAEEKSSSQEAAVEGGRANVTSRAAAAAAESALESIATKEEGEEKSSSEEAAAEGGPANVTLRAAAAAAEPALESIATTEEEEDKSSSKDAAVEGGPANVTLRAAAAAAESALESIATKEEGEEQSSSQEVVTQGAVTNASSGAAAAVEEPRLEANATPEGNMVMKPQNFSTPEEAVAQGAVTNVSSDAAAAVEESPLEANATEERTMATKPQQHASLESLEETATEEIVSQETVTQGALTNVSSDAAAAVEASPLEAPLEANATQEGAMDMKPHNFATLEETVTQGVLTNVSSDAAAAVEESHLEANATQEGIVAMKPQTFATLEAVTQGALTNVSSDAAAAVAEDPLEANATEEGTMAMKPQNVSTVEELKAIASQTEGEVAAQDV